ncbi:MAG: pyridoxamine kinase [Clostridia bacterium]|nr:pyridoxamine kinase [Clostridia bacterium]
MKRIVTIQDISCVGKCSLTVALPIISAMGTEAAVIPTAVLSTHTAFSNFTFCDLTKEIAPICEHWKNAGIGFDAIYTGYLGSFEQIELTERLIADFKTEENIILVDPAMADGGKLYKGFTVDFAKRMASLCAKADVIVPNLTEASFMLGIPYVDCGYDETYIRDVLKKLTDLGCKTAVLTGVSFEAGKLGVMSYNSETGEYFSYFRERIPESFHGTGDVYASTFLGALMRGRSVEDALMIATDFTVESIKATINNTPDRKYGVNFEEAVPYLVSRMDK